MDNLKITLVIIFSLLGFIILPYVIYKEMGPRYEAVRRSIYEESLAYNRGKNEHLNRLRLEYETSEPEHKAVLRTVILSEVASFDRDRLTPELQKFVNKLEGEIQ